MRIAILLALAAGCAPELAGTVLESARYELAWDTTATALDGDARVLTNDLGHEIRLTRASLVSYSASMVPCAPVSVASLFTTPIAHAGHGDLADPSSTDLPATEDLVSALPVELGAPTFARQGYCRLHYVVGVTGDARSLELEGTSDGVPFALSTSIATGMLLDLDELPITGGGSHAEIVFVRRVATLFDGIDPAAVDEEEGARAVLGNLIAGTETSIARGP